MVRPHQTHDKPSLNKTFWVNFSKCQQYHIPFCELDVLLIGQFMNIIWVQNNPIKIIIDIKNSNKNAPLKYHLSL